MGQVFYFAYGSNLDGKQMRARCASARVEARAVLTHHALAFSGFSRRWGGAVATVVPARGVHVEGLLYRLSRAELRVLDGYEGHPVIYERVSMRVEDEHGRHRRAQVYLKPGVGLMPSVPARRYIRVLRRAYGRLGFDAAHLAAAVEVGR